MGRLPENSSAMGNEENVTPFQWHLVAGPETLGQNGWDQRARVFPGKFEFEEIGRCSN